MIGLVVTSVLVGGLGVEIWPAEIESVAPESLSQGRQLGPTYVLQFDDNVIRLADGLSWGERAKRAWSIIPSTDALLAESEHGDAKQWSGLTVEKESFRLWSRVEGDGWRVSIEVEQKADEIAATERLNGYRTDNSGKRLAFERPGFSLGDEYRLIEKPPYNAIDFRVGKFFVSVLVTGERPPRFGSPCCVRQRFPFGSLRLN